MKNHPESGPHFRPRQNRISQRSSRFHHRRNALSCNPADSRLPAAAVRRLHPSHHPGQTVQCASDFHPHPVQSPLKPCRLHYTGMPCRRCRKRLPHSYLPYPGSVRKASGLPHYSCIRRRNTPASPEQCVHPACRGMPPSPAGLLHSRTWRLQSISYSSQAAARFHPDAPHRSYGRPRHSDLPVQHNHPKSEQGCHSRPGTLYEPACSGCHNSSGPRCILLQGFSADPHCQGISGKSHGRGNHTPSLPPYSRRSPGDFPPRHRKPHGLPVYCHYMFSGCRRILCCSGQSGPQRYNSAAKPCFPPCHSQRLCELLHLPPPVCRICQSNGSPVHCLFYPAHRRPKHSLRQLIRNSPPHQNKIPVAHNHSHHIRGT